MIFLGDFVYPFDQKVGFYEFDSDFLSSPKVVNLESLILKKNVKYEKQTLGVALHSSTYAFDILEELNVKAVGLANNHITDYDYNIQELLTSLNHKDIGHSGAGANLKEAMQASFIEDNDFKYAILSFGWDVIGCQNATKKKAGTAPLNQELILQTIRDIRQKYRDYKIILYLHWNYEFEYYPQPADRKLAFEAIDIGCDAVIGHHPHIVGVYEEYKNKPIFYSLGNFYVPEYTFGNFHLKYNKQASLGLGIKYHPVLENIQLYWINNSNNILSIKTSEKLYQTKILENFTNHFQNDLEEYASWFKENRIKKQLLPVYTEHNKSLRNVVNYFILKLRNYLIYKLTVFGLRRKKV